MLLVLSRILTHMHDLHYEVDLFLSPMHHLQYQNQTTLFDNNLCHQGRDASQERGDNGHQLLLRDFRDS